VKGGSSRFKGVSWAKERGKWMAQIQKDGKRAYFGVASSTKKRRRVHMTWLWRAWGGPKMLELWTVTLAQP